MITKQIKGNFFALGAGGRGFESRYPDSKKPLGFFLKAFSLYLKPYHFYHHKQRRYNTKKASTLAEAFFIVHPWGVEPQSSEPESDILSIELWVHLYFGMAKIAGIRDTAYISLINFTSFLFLVKKDMTTRLGKGK